MAIKHWLNKLCNRKNDIPQVTLDALSKEARSLLARTEHGWIIFEPQEKEVARELVQGGLASWGDYTDEDTRCVYITNRARDLLRIP